MHGYRLQQASRIARKIFNHPTYWAAKYIDQKDSEHALGKLTKNHKKKSS